MMEIMGYICLARSFIKSLTHVRDELTEGRWHKQVFKFTALGDDYRPIDPHGR